jgi:hypothetical protein
MCEVDRVPDFDYYIELVLLHNIECSMLDSTMSILP